MCCFVFLRHVTLVSVGVCHKLAVELDFLQTEKMRAG